MDPYLGQINLFGYPWAVTDWAMADGSLVPTSQNEALYALYGTYWSGAGNGETNFNLPDLRGRVPMGAGQAGGLTPRVMGDTGGEESVTMGGLAAAASPGSPVVYASSVPQMATTPPFLVMSYQVAMEGTFPEQAW